ncbi:hypothetical protein ACSBR2_028340 [Camellia fascicularis]
MSAYPFTTILMILTFFSPICTTAKYSHSTPCSEDFSASLPKSFTNCNKLNTLGAQFGWRLHNNESVIDICVGAMIETDEGWLAWGVNPQAKSQMAGTRAIIGFKKPDRKPSWNTYNVTSETKLGCRLMPSKIEDIDFRNVTFEYLNQIKYYKICATVGLSSEYNVSRLNHVWQVGFKSIGMEVMEPLKHKNPLPNMDSTETINLRVGTSESNAGPHRHRMRVAHGVLNMMGWGTLLPLGVIIARYFHMYPVHYNHWLRLHITCQITGYTLGTIGWGIGLWLGYASTYFKFPIHGLIANFIFPFTTLQMLALRLKPHSNDDYRKYWSIYHHFLGYSLLALIVVNIFRGIGIFSPNHTWRWAYIGVLCGLGFITLVFEIFTWIKFFKDLKKANKKKEEDGKNNKEEDGKKEEAIAKPK